jgi:hypothetical protein
MKETSGEENNGYVVFKLIFTDQLGNRVVGVVVRGKRFSPRPHRFIQQAFWTDIIQCERFFLRDICFMVVILGRIN